MKQTFTKVGEGLVINTHGEDLKTFKLQFEQVKERRKLQNEVRALREELEIVKKTLSQLLMDK